MYEGGRTSPIAGPQSTSTGQETSTGAQTMQESVERSVSPYSVESGGGIVHEMHDIGGRVHEMHGMPPYSLSISPASSIHHPHAMLTPKDSSPVELPTQFNVSSSNSNRTSVFSMARVSPNIPQTPVSDYFRPSHHRSRSTQSIDNVVTGRMSHFHELSDGGNGQHQRHGSEISEESSSNGKGPTRGSETIHEHEKIDTVE
jgi:hypothetical protein